MINTEKIGVEIASLFYTITDVINFSDFKLLRSLVIRFHIQPKNGVNTSREQIFSFKVTKVVINNLYVSKILKGCSNIFKTAVFKSGLQETFCTLQPKATTLLS